MNKLTHAVLLAALISANVSWAEVTHSAAGGFTTVNEVVIEGSRNDVWKTSIDQVGRWWSSDHTVSGDATRLSISSRPQGCFCETFASGGGVVHMTVTMVNPGVVIRLTGGLGPLGLMGVNGNMTWEYVETDGGTRVTFTYVVGGHSADGLDTIAAPVDFVIGEALHRLKAHVETGDANNAYPALD
jgi:uncharacterized protein YndB with AHSA1/START domain